MKKILCFAALLACYVCAHAQTFPSRPVRLIVSYPPGGGADLMARLVAPRMSEVLGQPVIVENKPGASGQIAAGGVARRPADGYTVLFYASNYALEPPRAPADGYPLLFDASNSAVTPSLFASLPYDPPKAFKPVAVLALFPNVLVVTPAFEARDVAGLIALAKARPGTIAFASSGNG